MAKKSTTKAESLGLLKLNESGLNAKDAKALGITFLNAKQTDKLNPSFKDLCSIKLAYFGPDGKPLKDWPGSNPFYRIRYLETATDFAAMADKKPRRYAQEPNTAPVAYYPKNQEGWPALLKDTAEPLIITEGEFKAAKACKEGFPTIGLGGVYNWRAHKLGIQWLESLSLVNWVRRNVYICFDSDYKTNPAVCGALKSLADELQRRGALCHLVNLPQLPGLDKVGLDDFLMNAGPTSVDMFADLLSMAEPLGLAAPLFELNERYTYIRDPGLIIAQHTKFKVSPGAFKEHLEATLNYQKGELRADGTLIYKTVSASAGWLKWPLRSEAARLAYSPGKERFINEPSEFNVWPGWGIEPKKGSAKPFLDLIDHLFTGGDSDAKKWFMSWCACPIQNPGLKMFSSAVLHGIRTGTGKSLIGYTLAKIYGKNFTEVNQMDIHERHNEWAEAKQFVMGDDVTGSNKRQDADFLKKMITQKELRLNPKYIPSYVVPDRINYYFTTNHADAFFLEDDDRRFFVHEVQVGPLSEDFYIKYDKWLHKENGAAAVFYYLQNLNIKGFNPAAAAFRTEARARMITNMQSDLGGWVRQLLSNTDYVLQMGKIKITKDLFTSKELLMFYDPTGATGTTANGLSRELARGGAMQILSGRPIKMPDGSQGRYYAIRNQEKWLKLAGPGPVIKHLTDWSKKQSMKPTKKY